MGGGNKKRNGQPATSSGLSPRGRGKQEAQRPAGHIVGSIPAWAGETQQPPHPVQRDEVYPRVGGGNRRPLPLTAVGAGSIPAWAGETTPEGIPGHRQAVYPRVGGGNSEAYFRAHILGGLSPRGRGKLPRLDHHRQGQGSIPAWAGETPSSPATRCWGTVYPRVGGGNPNRELDADVAEGLSPRGRGKRAAGAPAYELAGSIPAWAGETDTPCWRSSRSGVYPRVGGGNGPPAPRPMNWPGLSPRGRGKPSQAVVGTIGKRSIPAWAGETGKNNRCSPQRKVYPRVGGGNPWRVALSWPAAGLSPRGRGKHTEALDRIALHGSIPAWAGETCWWWRAR